MSAADSPSPGRESQADPKDAVDPPAVIAEATVKEHVDPQVQDLISEEKRHLAKAERKAAEPGGSAVAERAVEHAEEQVKRAVTIKHYEEILDATLRNLDLDSLFPEILGRIRAMLEADEVTVYLLEDGGKTLYARASVGMEEAVTRPIRIPVGAGVAGSVLASRQSETLYDVNDATVANPLLLAMGIKSLLAAPIMVGEEAVGVLTVGCIDGHEFEVHEIRLLEVVAERVGLGIERTRVLRQAELERERAERAARFMTTLLHMASHDIRTPLTAIKLQVHALKGTFTPEASAKALSIVDRSVTRLELLLDDFLDLARVEAGRFTLRRQPVDLRKIADEVAEMFAAQATQRKLEINVTGDSVTLDGDERRLTQVLVNLVSNAVRYTPSGSVSIAVGRTDRIAKPGASATLVVQDTGMGMTADQIDRLFQPFSQVHEAVEEGTGLGLHLSKVLVDAHGGSIRVESPGKDQGTSVIVELPFVARPARGQRPARKARDERAASGEPAAARAAPSARPA